MSEHGMMRDALVYLAAAVVCVPLAKRLGLGSVLGYLVAGCLIGPWGLALVSNVDSIRHFAEFGVVLMLFLIGLELDLKRLMQLRRPVFLGGSLQMASCGVLLAAGLAWAGLPWPGAVVAGLALAMSSTAIALQTMAERSLAQTPAGRAAFGVLLFQDIAAIPLLAVVPVMGAAHSAEAGWRGALEAIGAIAAVIVIGRFLTLPLMRLIARADVREVFTAFALLLVLGIAELMTAANLSMALGAFLAGVLLASSEYRHALETDIAPFKGLLLGLFFIAVGMSVDFSLVVSRPLMLLALVIGLVGLKSLALAAIAPRLTVPPSQRFLLAALLSQGGEFAFVVLGLARQVQILPGAWESLLTAAVALSMGLTPLLILAHDRLQTRQARRAAASQAIDSELAEQRAPVIIAGFGRYGQIVGRLLMASGWQVTVLDHDPDQIEAVRRFGYKVFYGDATRLDLLEAAGAAQARLFVVAIDGVEDSLAVVDRVRTHYPHLAIVARARNVRHWLELRERGVMDAERESFGSALLSGRQALQALGATAYEAREIAEAFRRANLATLHGMEPHFRDEQKAIDIAKSGRVELEENLRQDALTRARVQGEGWR
jgi:glutathione-regulated potassium-efflux system ancillary protein KefC